jgi:hypothetical protein
MKRNQLNLVASAGLVALLWGPSLAFAQVSPSLGAAASYSILAGSQVTNTGTTAVSGDVGIYPGGAGPPSNHPGLTPVMVGGTIHDADTAAANAQADMNAAYTTGLGSQACTVTYPGTKELAGATLVPGVYCADRFFLSSGTLTLSGISSNVWVFKSAADLIITGGAAAKVVSPSCNVWWRVVSSATFDAYSSLTGNILADTSITLAAYANLSGKALARTAAVTLSSNAIAACTAAPPPSPLPPTLAKIFSPTTIGEGGVSTLTITLNNPNTTVASLVAALSDSLPSGVRIAATPNASTTCAGSGAVDATGNGTTVTLPATRSIPAGSGTTPGTCTVTVNVTAPVGGSYVNLLAANALQTSNGNNAAAVNATLTVTPGVPTLPGWAMIVLTALLALVGFAAMRRRAI